jgi:hypothetical protein
MHYAGIHFFYSLVATKILNRQLFLYGNVTLRCALSIHLTDEPYFSANNRVYFSTANFDDADSIMNKSLQYACINGVEQEPINVEVDKRGTYIIRTFAI